MKELHTKRLIIRYFEEDDYKDLYEYLSDKNVVYFEPYEPYSLEQSIQEAKNRAECHDFYAVCLKDSNKLIGNLYLGKRDFDAWEIGYVFNKNYQGKGFATEAATGLIQYVFDELGARRIIAECNPENENSWKLLERLELRREGHMIKNIYFKTGENNEPIWQDTYIYGMLKSEWKF